MFNFPTILYCNKSVQSFQKKKVTHNMNYIIFNFFFYNFQLGDNFYKLLQKLWILLNNIKM